jgi:hypothetical protein
MLKERMSVFFNDGSEPTAANSTPTPHPQPFLG